MGYEVLYGPEIAPDGTHPERESYREPLLTGRLRAALLRLNPDLPLPRREQPRLPPVPHRSVTVEYRDDDGAVRHGIARIIDPSRPEKNDWLAVNQYTIFQTVKASLVKATARWTSSSSSGWTNPTSRSSLTSSSPK
ncbi:type I restriction endonuclease [Methanofollis formosanus]|nr:type I restriction endonuclease [Methanofollis formosanus]